MANQPTFNSAEDVINQVKRMEDFYKTGATRPYEHRHKALVDLKRQLVKYEGRILKALHDDLGKAPFESYETELGLVYDEINTCVSHLKKWMAPQHVSTPLFDFPASSTVYQSPMGVVAVLSPWNYPVQLALIPLVDALAAGNCVALKPSRTSVNTGKVLIDVLSEIFPSEFVCGFPGSGDMNNWLLEPHFDFVCFTGSPKVGKVIMGAAAKHLTPVLLELGGKSPCIIDETANVKRAAERVAWGKGVNSGQTCVAPDYFLVHEDVVLDFVASLEVYFHHFYGDNILECDQWPHIISKHHYDRLMGLIESHNDKAIVAFGGKGDPDTLKIEPTCLMGVTLNDPVMGEEIFGPVLPIITYKELDEVFEIIDHFEHPLATYVFSEDHKVQDRVIDEVRFGGACVNDVLVHVTNNNMGFGGFGNSGMGQYHGKRGFDTFSHYKSVLKNSTKIDVGVRNPPFTSEKFKMLKRLMH